MQQKLLKQITVSLHSKLEDVELVRLALQDLIRHCVSVKKETIAINVIVDELVSNSVRHAYNNSDGPIEARMSIYPGQFTLAVTDQGRAFNPTVPPELTDTDRPGIGGRGLTLVHGLCDSIEYERSNGSNRTIVRISITATNQSEKSEKTMTTGLTIEDCRENRTATVALFGRIDSANASHLTEHLTNLVNCGYVNLKIDLKELEYLTSAGFRTLLIASDAAEDKGGKLSLTRLSPDVTELFELSGLDQAFRIE